MTKWLYGKKDRAAVCDLFKAHRNDEIECERHTGAQGWSSTSYDGVFFEDDVRYRLKPRKLAPHWKELEGAEQLPRDIALITYTTDAPAVDELYCTLITFSDAKSFQERGFTHYAALDDIFFGVDDE